MSEIQKILLLDGNSYRLYAYIRERVDKENNVLNNVSKADVMEDLSLSPVTLRRCTLELKNHDLVDFNGYKNRWKLLK